MCLSEVAVTTRDPGCLLSCTTIVAESERTIHNSVQWINAWQVGGYGGGVSLARIKVKYSRESKVYKKMGCLQPKKSTFITCARMMSDWLLSGFVNHYHRLPLLLWWTRGLLAKVWRIASSVGLHRHWREVKLSNGLLSASNMTTSSSRDRPLRTGN